MKEDLTGQILRLGRSSAAEIAEDERGEVVVQLGPGPLVPRARRIDYGIKSFTYRHNAVSGAQTPSRGRCSVRNKKMDIPRKGKARKMPERLVIVGGDAAGMSAATQARRRRDSSELQIVAFERGRYTSYSACGIPYYVGGTVEELETLIVRSPEAFRQNNEIDAHINHEVTALHVDARKVTVRDLENSVERTEGFDQLVIATGATPVSYTHLRAH